MRPVWQMLWNYQPTLLGLRFVVSFLILLVPTTAMGLTLPVIIEDPLLRETEFGRAIGFLYGSNTLGAMLGAVLGEAYLIGAFGLYGTSLAAAAAVCIAAAIALAVARFGAARYVADFKGADPFEQSKFPLSFDASYRPPWRLLFVSFGTGLVLLALEVIWFRFLRLYVVSLPTAFAIMLAVVLAGIGLGGIAAGAINRRSTWLNQLLPVLFLLAAIAVLLSYLFFPGEAVRTPAGAFSLASWHQIALLCLALMFPASFLSGILFPTIVALVQASAQNRMNSTGITTLFNTTGAAARSAHCKFRAVADRRLSMESHLVCCSVCVCWPCSAANEPRWSFRRPITFTIAALYAALILLIAIVLHTSRGSAFRTREPSLRNGRSGHLVAQL